MPIELAAAPLRGAAERDLSLTLFGKRMSMPVIDRADRSLPACSGRRRVLRGARRERSRNGVLPEPRLRLHARAACRTGAVAALDAGLHLSGSRFHARADRACGGGRLRCARPHDRQPAARQSRARSSATASRFHRASAGRHRENGVQGAAGCGACARSCKRITFGNYVRPGEIADIKQLAGRMASLLDPRDVVEGCRRSAQHLERARSS